MSERLKARTFLWLILPVLVLAVCQTRCTAATIRALTPTAERVPGASSTPRANTPRIAPTASLTPEPLPSLTLSPDLRISPAPYLPSPFSGAVPLGAVARLGQGVLNIVRPSPNGKYLAVGGSMGVTVYETESYSQVWFGRTAASVSLLEWSPDGRRIAAALVYGTIIVWDASNGARVLKKESVCSVTLNWSPDSKRLVTGACGSGVYVWDAMSGAHLLRIDPMSIADNPPQGPSLTFAAPSPDGKLIATTYRIGGGDAIGNDERIDIWDAATGAYLRTLAGLTSLQIAWSPDSKLLAAVSDQGMVIWNTETAEVTERLEAEDIPDRYFIDGISWSPNGGRLAATDSYQTTAVFNIESGDTLPPLDNRGQFAGWSADSTRYATVEGTSLIVRDAFSGTEIGRISGINRGVGFSADGVTFYAWTAMQNGTLAAWNIQTGLQRSVITTGTRKVQSVTWSPDGTRLATGSISDWGSSENEVVIWDVGTHEASHAFVPQNGTSENRIHVAWSPIGETLAIGNFGVSLLDVESGQDVGTLPTGEVASLAWSPDGSRVVVGDYSLALNIWDAHSDASLYSLEGHQPDRWGNGEVLSVDWSPDGNMLASVGSDGSVILWDASTGEQIRALDIKSSDSVGIDSVAFSPNGSLLAASVKIYTAQDIEPAGEFVTIWDVKTGTPLLKLQGPQPQHPSSSTAITSVSWSPDGSKLAAAYGSPQEQIFTHMFSIGGPSIVLVWDVTTGQILHEFEGHTSDVQSVAFSPDGVHLASGSLDGTVIVWDVSQ